MIAMAEKADFGFVIWDGKSLGSFTNMLELLKNNKKALVYFHPENRFYRLSNFDDADKMLTKCDESTIGKLVKKLGESTSSGRSVQAQVEMF
jgi:hypothetical protein